MPSRERFEMSVCVHAFKSKLGFFDAFATCINWTQQEKSLNFSNNYLFRLQTKLSFSLLFLNVFLFLLLLFFFTTKTHFTG